MPRLALLGLSLGYFMVLFDTTALTVALPDLGRDLGGGVDSLAWVVDGYTLTFASCLLGAGVLADRYGADRAFLAGVASFGGLSLACAAAPSIASLVVGRGLLGVAGALLLPASLASIAALHPEPARRASAIATWAAISGSALSAGPLLGGALVAGIGWRGIFLVNVPVAILAALLLRGRLPAVRRSAARLDLRSQAAAVVAVVATTWALIRFGTRAPWAPGTLAGLVVALIAGLLAIRAERRSRAPAVARETLRAPAFTAALTGGLVVGGILAGELFLTTLQLQEVRGLSPMVTGAAFLPLTIPMVLNPPLAGRLVARVGPARPVLGGLLLIAAATVVLASVSTADNYAGVAAGLALLGLGISFTLPALTSAVVLAAPPGAVGGASGLFSVVRQTGATIGVAACTATIGANATAGAHGHELFAVAALLAAIAWARSALVNAPSKRRRPAPSKVPASPACGANGPERSSG